MICNYKGFVIESEEVILDRIASRSNQVNFERIGRSSPLQADDLKKIRGIGVFTIRKLNALGFYTFRQLAVLSDEDVELINELIEYFPGRVQRENWVGQAQSLLSNHKIEREDDLKVIEGIGPRIEELLKSNGIKSFSELAEQSIDRLKEILDLGGPRFKLHDPTTWPAQADLAAHGKRRELTSWQKELQGGNQIKSKTRFLNWLFS